MDHDFFDPNGLNALAMSALRGLIDRPETALANLLRSEVQLTPNVRNLMADALEGKNGPIGLKATGRSVSQSARTYRKRRESLRRGLRVQALRDRGVGYDDAIEQIAESEGRGIKSVIADLAFARKATDWIVRCRASTNQLNWPDDVLLTLFATAAARKAKPDEIFWQALRETQLTEARWNNRA